MITDNAIVIKVGRKNLRLMAGQRFCAGQVIKVALEN
jgi:hypothetical protein